MTNEEVPENEKIVRSPLAQLASKVTFPEVSLPKFIFQVLKLNEKSHGDTPALIDAVKGKAILFKEIEALARKFATSLNNLGFKKGDVLYYMTYNASLLYVLHFGVWLCGGAVRGCFQTEEKEEVERQMRETKCRFLLCDKETAPRVKWAMERLGWPTQLFSIDGEVEGAKPVEDMVYKDDIPAFTEEVQINPKEDLVFIPSTNGSTGLPKGALHTHFNIVTFLIGLGAPLDLERLKIPNLSILSVMGNFNIGPFISFQMTLIFGQTFISISKFDKSSFFEYIDRYKPKKMFLFPYLANWFARCPEIEKHDLKCISEIVLGGSVVDSSIISIMNERLPFIFVSTIFGMTETLVISSLSIGQLQGPQSLNAEPMKTKITKLENDSHVSCGALLPLVQAKIVDIETGKILGRKEKGKVIVKTPCVMKGYIKSDSSKGYTSEVDADGWLDTGDVGFFDEDGHLYIVDRLKEIFKYNMYMVSPAEVERIIGDHPAVLSAAVVGVPDEETTSAARAYVIVKPGCTVTEDDIMKHVADKAPVCKHLHKGVVFVDKLPQTRGGKLDRKSLLQRAITEIKGSS